jgi:periplasmic protein CpxP/Spy
MNKLLGSTLVSVCIAALTGSVAVAQTTPNTDSRSARSHGESFADRAFARPTERVEARLAYVKTALKITDAQHSQWDAYANLVRKNAQDMEQRFTSRKSAEPGHPRHQRPNAIERLERAQAFHAETVTRINQLLSVEKPLYAALSPEQQKVADVVLNRGIRSKQGPSMGGRGGFGRG